MSYKKSSRGLHLIWVSRYSYYMRWVSRCTSQYECDVGKATRQSLIFSCFFFSVIVRTSFRTIVHHAVTRFSLFAKIGLIELPTLFLQKIRVANFTSEISFEYSQYISDDSWVVRFWILASMRKTILLRFTWIISNQMTCSLIFAEESLNNYFGNCSKFKSFSFT